VDEAKRALFGAVSLKSFDFIVYSSIGDNLLADVKGRKFPDPVVGKSSGKRMWENWITRGDVEGLSDWQRVFGEGFSSVLVFAYWLQGPPQRAPFEDVHLFRERYYAFRAIGLEQYVAMAHPRSQKWQTLSVGAGALIRKSRGIVAFLYTSPDCPVNQLTSQPDNQKGGCFRCGGGGIIPP